MKKPAVVQCASCRRTWTLEAWRASPPAVRLTAGDIGGYVVGWPAGSVVEVRPCEGCGRPIARRTHETAA
jgi:hypothetical protein